MNLRSRQRGLSALAMLVVMLVAIFFGTCTLKLAPHYLGSMTVKSVVESAVEQAKASELTTAEIKKKLGSEFTVNMIDAIQLKDIKVSRKKGVTTVDARYEKRIPLMFNIDVVVKFDQLIYEF